MAARLAPLAPPYEPDIQAAFERIMPPDVPPLALFRTVARNGRVFGRLMAGGLLDKGSLSLREREILIDRTSALCGAEYEWGVHVAFFTDQQLIEAITLVGYYHAIAFLVNGLRIEPEGYAPGFPRTS